MMPPWPFATGSLLNGRERMTRWCRRQGAESKISPRVAWPPAHPKKTELKLIGVAGASLEELLLDFEDFLRQREFIRWSKDYPKAKEVRRLCYKKNRSYKTYKTYIEKESPEVAANTAVCMIHQANYLFDQQLRTLEKDFLKEGGFTERLYRTRIQARNRGRR